MNSVDARDVRYGQAHGTLMRTAFPATDAERARFEVPAQRWAHVTSEEAGFAVFTPDLYGWNAVGLRNGCACQHRGADRRHGDNVTLCKHVSLLCRVSGSTIAPWPPGTGDATLFCA